MRVITILALTVAGLASLACCDSKFIQPPELGSKQPSDTDMTKNKRYEQGDKIQIEYETDIDQIAIEIHQVPLNGASAYSSLARNGSANPSYWLADQGRVARSEYFNVSSSKAVETTSGSISAPTTGPGLTTLTSEQHASTSTAGSETDTEPASTSSSTNSGSGLSQGATAGITAGAIIGGLLILGSIGWFVWRRVGKGRKNVNGTEGAQDQQHHFYSLETKVELPSDITTHPSEYAASRPGLHEAP